LAEFRNRLRLSDCHARQSDDRSFQIVSGRDGIKSTTSPILIGGFSFPRSVAHLQYDKNVAGGKSLRHNEFLIRPWSGGADNPTGQAAFRLDQ
jgi:hypothetical protein